MSIAGIIIVTVVCAVATVFLYNSWKQEFGREQEHDRDCCVTKGDMYCGHTDWCEAEKILFPEQYEEEMKRLENDKNQSK